MIACVRFLVTAVYRAPHRVRAVRGCPGLAVRRLVTRLGSIAPETIVAKPVVRDAIACVRIVVAAVIRAPNSIGAVRSRALKARAVVAEFLPIAPQIVVAARRGGRLLVDPVSAVVIHTVAHFRCPRIHGRIRVVAVIPAARLVVVSVTIAIRAPIRQGDRKVGQTVIRVRVGLISAQGHPLGSFRGTHPVRIGIVSPVSGEHIGVRGVVDHRVDHRAHGIGYSHTVAC